MNRTASSPRVLVLAFGGTCQIGQILFLREFLTVFHGNEMAIALILATWMLWVGAGSRLGYGLAESARDPVKLVFRSSLMAAILLPATLPFIRGARLFHGVLPGTHLAVPEMVLTCLVVTAPLGCLLGLQFVLLARVWREHVGRTDTHAAGSVYIGEAAGAIAGGILFTFVLVRWANAFQAAALAGGFLGVSAWLLLRSSQADGNVWRPAIFFALLAAAAWPALDIADAWADRLQWRSMAPEHRLVAVHPSKHGKIHVAQREDQLSFFQSGHLLFTAAGPGAGDPALEETEAAALAHLTMAQHPHPRRVLLIGGGMRGTLREILRHGVDTVDYVELDPVLLAAARPVLGRDSQRALSDPRVQLHHGDGRLFVKAAEATFDVILVDAPDPATAVLNRLYTREFFTEASARLRPAGILAVSALSTPDLRGRAAANRNATLFHTLREVFPHVLAVGDRSLLFFASHDATTLSQDPAVLRERYGARNIDAAVFSPLRFEILLEEGPLRRINWILRHHGRHPHAHLEAPPAAPLFPPPPVSREEEDTLPPVYAPAFINTDFRPVGYYHTLEFWNALARAEDAAAFAWMARARAWWIFPPVGAALALALFLRCLPQARARRAGPAFAVRCAVFTTGLSTMTMQVALLFSFQAIHGFVYEQAGLIVAVFMAGLLCGTLLAQHKVRDKTDMRILARVQLAIALFATIMAVALPAVGALPSPSLILSLLYLLTVMAGFFNGLDFPLATASCGATTGGRAEKAAGVVYGLELFGACAGAALASAVIAPVLGIAACCYLAAIANAAAFLILTISRRPEG